MHIGPFRSSRFPLRRGLLSLAVVSGLIALAAIPSPAQEEVKKAKVEQPIDPDALALQQVQLPKEGVNYRAIEDGKPLATAKSNPAEWDAYQRVIAHVSQVPLKALKLRHREGIPFSELTDAERSNYWRELLLIKGRLYDLKKVDVSESMPSLPQKDIYEGWMYQDGVLHQRVKIVVTELPEGFKLGDEVDEPIELDAYYFKYANFSGEKAGDQPAPKYAPLMIGRSFRIVQTAPPPVNPQLSEAEQVQLPPYEFFSDVKDKRPLSSVTDNYNEYLAYTFTFEHLMRFRPEVLARNSRKDIVYADLINDIRDPEYLRKLLHIEGKMVRVRRRDAKELLKMPDVPFVYDAWVYFEGDRQQPINVAFTELPEEIETGERIHAQVAFDGYYFKLLGYKSMEKDDKGKDVWRVAPLLVARRPQLLTDRRETYSWSDFGPIVLGVIGGVMVIALGLAIWFRVGDKRTRARVREAVVTNPFDNQSPPAVQPGTAWGDVATDR